MPTLKLTGEVSVEAATAFAQKLAALSPNDENLNVDLSEADLTDGQATARLVQAIRQTARRLSSIHVLEPPQALAHCLYRVGALGSGSTIHLVCPREELGTSS